MLRTRYSAIEGPAPVFSAETTAFLESGCALIVGTVGADGEPLATRGWGIRVRSRAAGTIRVLVPAEDARVWSNLAATGAVAVTGGDVKTLRSIQMKGSVVAVETATDDDRATHDRYCEDFFGAVESVDGTPHRLLERLRPAGLVACVVEVRELFDQTPGPVAGSALPGDTG